MRRQKIAGSAVKMIVALALLLSLLGTAACGSPQAAPPGGVHVAANGNDSTGDGTPGAPYATFSRAAAEHQGSLIIVHGGDYGPAGLGPDCSGSEGSPTVIRAAEGERVIIHAGDGTGISLVNISHILLEGLIVEGGTHGIEYTGTREAAERPLSDITVRNCVVRGVRGVHGICVYARNDLAPVTGLTVEGCEVYDCECGSSESLVLNGNIDGFLIAGNTVHDNDNIGIDMIGFEGTAAHPDAGPGVNPSEVDYVRNGVCRDNVVYNISSEGNEAYYGDGEYDLCADGIYVDGGQDIEIYNNFIFNCDIGLEVATEHSPDDNEMFGVSGIRVHDNVIAGCKGWAGICFGGYDRDLGFTENCEFSHNTLVDNETQIAVQRSRNNTVTANLIIGGETGIEFSEVIAPEDMSNDIGGNVAAEIEDEESWSAGYGISYPDREDIADGFRSLDRDTGSRFVPGSDMIKLYNRLTRQNN